MLPRPSLNWQAAWKNPGVRRVLMLMAPALIGVSVSQISLLINTIFASFLTTGSVSWLYYADRLMEFPSGMLGAALGTILLPSLSRYHASANHEDNSKLLDWGLRLTLLLAAPAALALAFWRYRSSAHFFSTAHFLWWTSCTPGKHSSLCYRPDRADLGQSAGPGFYARQNVRTPVRIALISLFATQAMNLAFIGWLQHAGLALSIGLAACLNAAMLYRGLRKQEIFAPQPGWAKFITKLVLAMLTMGATLWFSMGTETSWLENSMVERLARLAWIIRLAQQLFRYTMDSRLPPWRLQTSGG